MPFELFVALRYLVARRKQAFISLISLVSTLGVAVGVMALIIALALMTGLQQELRDRIVGSAAHVYVWKIEGGGTTDYREDVRKLGQLPRVVGAAPSILGKALVTAQGEAFITVKGIDPALEREVTEIGSAIRSGSLDALSHGDGPGGILLGVDLAENLGVFVGDDIRLVTQSARLSPMGPIPIQQRLKVVGIFSLGLYEYDSTYGFVSLDTARRLFRRDAGRVDLLELRVDDIYAAREVADSINDTLGPAYAAEDWSEMNRSLFSALWLEKMALAITIGLIVTVAALNIVASLILLVMEKSRDIAILKTMGAQPHSIMGIFMLQGSIIGCIGTTIGAVAGYGISRVLDTYQLIQVPIDVYQISHVPFTVEWPAFGIVVASALVICFVATIYPSRQAARLDPAEALRYQ